MGCRIFVTRDWDQMSKVAADLIEADIRDVQRVKGEYVLGLATGNSPAGVYKHLAKAFNAKRIEARRVRSFNLDEYVGLPGENAQQRALHSESYSYYMIAEFFGLLQEKFLETNVPGGTVIEQPALVKALEEQPDDFAIQGSGQGKAVVIRASAGGYLKKILEEILEAYEKRIEARGGIDLQIVGVGGRGHVAFHESGIPFEGSRVLLVKLDDSTVSNAVADGHFATREDSPRYGVSMGTELVYQARTVLLVASGPRKTAPVGEAILGEVTPEVPISYGQRYAARGGKMIYVIDEVAAAQILRRVGEVRGKGCEIVDMRGVPCDPVSALCFARDPETGRLG